MHRLREALRDGAQLGVEERAREVGARLDVRRVGAAAQREHHLVRRGDERVADHLERDRRRSSRDLPVGEVVRVLRRVALRRVAPAAAARRAVHVDVARARSWSRTSTAAPPRCRPAWMQEVRRRARPAAPPCSPYGGCAARSERTISDVSGVRQRQTRSTARPPRCSPGAARVGHEPVALDHDRELGLRDLDRDVRGEARRVRQPVVAVVLGRAAPGADDELVEDEAVAAVGALGAEDRRACCRPRRLRARGPGSAARARRSPRRAPGSR